MTAERGTLVRIPSSPSRPFLHGREDSFDFEVLNEFPNAEEMRSHFHRVWGSIEENLDLPLTSDEALRRLQSLVIYDIPDGTRSTLSMRTDIDVGFDAALYCLALIHTLKCLGATSCVIMTHTVYNRERGTEGLQRILKLMAQGAKPVTEYSERKKIWIRLIGMKKDYELETNPLFQPHKMQGASFKAFFLVDYEEGLYSSPELRGDLDSLPDVDVCIRHTKLNLSGGGWIPSKLLKSAFMYCQNGTLYSNWTFEELVALVTLGLVSKLINSGEGLVKMYGDIDEVKARYQLRELRLFNRQVYLRREPTKLFLVGSPHGIYQFYY